MIRWLASKVPVFYKDLGPSIKGRSKGLWIEIDNKYKDDIGLLEHERCHVRQFFRTVGFHGVLTLISKTYKYNSEVEAFGYSLYYKNRSIADVKRTLKYDYGFSDEIMKGFDSEILLSIDKAKEYIDG